MPNAESDLDIYVALSRDADIREIDAMKLIRRSIRDRKTARELVHDQVRVAAESGNLSLTLGAIDQDSWTPVMDGGRLRTEVDCGPRPVVDRRRLCRMPNAKARFCPDARRAAWRCWRVRLRVLTLVLGCIRIPERV